MLILFNPNFAASRGIENMISGSRPTRPCFVVMTFFLSAFLFILPFHDAYGSNGFILANLFRLFTPYTFMYRPGSTKPVYYIMHPPVVSPSSLFRPSWIQHLTLPTTALSVRHQFFDPERRLFLAHIILPLSFGWNSWSFSQTHGSSAKYSIFKPFARDKNRPSPLISLTPGYMVRGYNSTNVDNNSRPFLSDWLHWTQGCPSLQS